MATMSPLRRRMIEDMTVRNLSSATQQSYLYAVAKFSRHFGAPPARLGTEQVRAYQLHLIAQKRLWSHINQVACALRFFYGVTLGQKRRALDQQLAGILATASCCDLTRALQVKISRARDQLLTFLDHPGRVEVTNNACERALRPAVIQRKVTNGYRAMWAAEGEAAVRTVVDTARLTSGTTVFGTVLKTVSA